MLAERIRRGDTVAFKIFFERYYHSVFNYLRSRRVAPAVSEDLIQQVFLQIWEGRLRIDPDKSLRAFLFTSCYNRALNHFRDTARFVPAEGLETIADTQASDAAAAYHLMEDTLQGAIEALPEKRRKVFELCFIQELTYREAAETLGLSIKTIENQMGHALKSVRLALAPFHQTREDRGGGPVTLEKSGMQDRGGAPPGV